MKGNKYLRFEIITQWVIYSHIIMLVSLFFYSCNGEDNPPPEQPTYRLWLPPEELWNDMNPPGSGWQNASVAPVAWQFCFIDKSNHLQEIALWTDNIRFELQKYIHWQTKFRAIDKSRDDQYKWKVWYNAVAMHHSCFLNGYSGVISDPSDDNVRQSFYRSIEEDNLKGFATTTVVLNGWRFGLWGNSDHEIRNIMIDISNSRYNSVTGKFDFWADANFVDQAMNDDYYWSFNFLIIAFNGKAVSKEIREKHDDDHNKEYLIEYPEDYGPINQWKPIVLLQGWEIEHQGGSGFTPYDTDVQCIKLDITKWRETEHGIMINPEVRFPHYYSLNADGSLGSSVPNFKIRVVALFLKDFGGVNYAPWSDSFDNLTLNNQQTGGTDTKQYTTEVNWTY